MSQIKLDANLASQLEQVETVVELCDPSGRVLGKFIRSTDLDDWEAITPEVSEEELERRLKSTKWYTTAEVLAHLKSLESN